MRARLVTVCFCPVAVKQTPCPPGHIRYRDLCLVLEELWLTWDEAAELCRCKGGRLLELDGVDMPEEGTKEGEKEQQLLEQKLDNCAGSWIGSRKRKHSEGSGPGCIE